MTQTCDGKLTEAVSGGGLGRRVPRPAGFGLSGVCPAAALRGKRQNTSNSYFSFFSFPLTFLSFPLLYAIGSPVQGSSFFLLCPRSAFLRGSACWYRFVIVVCYVSPDLTGSHPYTHRASRGSSSLRHQALGITVTCVPHACRVV